MVPGFAVLFVWLLAYPLVGGGTGTMWPAHVFAVVALGVCAIAPLWRQPRVALGLPALAALAALASLLLALRFAPDALPRREMQWAAVTGAAHVLLFLALLRLMPGLDAPPQETRRARLLLMLLLAAIVVGQALAVWAADDSQRAAGTLGNPNTLGAIAGACGLALAGLLGMGRAAFLAVLSVMPLVLATRSRGAMAALAATLVLLAVRRRRWKLLAAVAVLVAAVLLVPNPLAERIDELQPEHSFTRVFLWSAALESIAEHPLGIGPGMNQYVFPAHAWDAEHPWLLHQRHSVGLTHNVLLTLTLEWGWMAGAAALGLVAWVALRARSPGRGDDRLSTGAALGATVLFLEMQVDGLEQNPIAFSLFLLLAATTIVRLPRTTPLAAAAAGGLAISGRAAALLLAAALATLGGIGQWRVRGLFAAHEAAQALAAWEEGRMPLSGVRSAIDEAEQRLSGDDAVALLRCDMEETNVRRTLASGATEAAIAAASEPARVALALARAVNPADPLLPRRAVAFENELFWRTGLRAEWQARSFEALEGVLALDPLDVQAHWELAHMAQRAGLRELRDQQADIALRLEPDYALAWNGLSQLYEADGDLERALHAAVRAEEALLNCRIKVRFPQPASSAFYLINIETVDLTELRARIDSLRERLYS